MKNNLTDILKLTIDMILLEDYGISSVEYVVEHPANVSWGDYSTNVALVIAKIVKQSPTEVAKNILYRIQGENIRFANESIQFDLFSEIYIAPPGFINLRVAPKWFYNVLIMILQSNDSYGTSKIGDGKKILIEYSQPNPNKPQHIGHARNNFLGSSLVNLMRFIGYEVVSANYINDWGTHICKAMLMYEKFGGGSVPDVQPDHFVGNFYSMYEKEEDKNPDIINEVNSLFQKLENGDRTAIELWKKITGWVFEGWERTYGDQNISFDVWFYQSQYKDSGKEIVDFAIKNGVAEKDATGAVIARLREHGIPDKVLLRADGTSVYSTQDLQMAKDNVEKMSLDKRIYVVDYRQSDYFAQLFKVLEIMGFKDFSKLVHVPYGVVKLPEGNMSSRKGLVVTADEVFEALVEREEVEIKNSNRKLFDKGNTVKKIAMGAFKYGMLKVDSSQNIVFDYANAARFEGNTGPYLQYTFARASSVLKSSGFSIKPDVCTYEISRFDETMYDEKEANLLRRLNMFSEVVVNAALSYSPHVMCGYLFGLSQDFNSFYASNTILDRNENVKMFRLMLTSSVRQVLQNGLTLLGIEPVEEM